MGNGILGKKEFLSRASSAGVTSTSELRTTVKDGQIINVIDTPGLFDSSVDTEYIGKEIVKCINMAREGIHAVLVVLSVRNRFSKEDLDLQLQAEDRKELAELELQKSTEKLPWPTGIAGDMFIP